jgi:hypothetical protein
MLTLTLPGMIKSGIDKAACLSQLVNVEAAACSFSQKKVTNTGGETVFGERYGDLYIVVIVQTIVGPSTLKSGTIPAQATQTY